MPVALAIPAIIAVLDVEWYNFEFSTKPIDIFADIHTNTFAVLEG